MFKILYISDVYVLCIEPRFYYKLLHYTNKCVECLKFPQCNIFQSPAPNVDYHYAKKHVLPNEEDRDLGTLAERKEKAMHQDLADQFQQTRLAITASLTEKVVALETYVRATTEVHQEQALDLLFERARNYINAKLPTVFAEGTMNCYEHGNKCNLTKPIGVNVSLVGDISDFENLEVVLKIGDMGEGFSMDKVPRTLKQRMERWETGVMGGMGIDGMIELYSDEVSYSKEDMQFESETIHMHVLTARRKIFGETEKEAAIRKERERN